MVKQEKKTNKKIISELEQYFNTIITAIQTDYDCFHNHAVIVIISYYKNNMRAPQKSQIDSKIIKEFNIRYSRVNKHKHNSKRHMSEK